MEYLFILGAVTFRGTYGVGYKLIANKPPAKIFNRWIVLFAAMTYAIFIPLCETATSNSRHCTSNFSYYGFASGLSNTLACFVAFEAIRLVGVALSQVIAAGVGIFVSFIWGVTIFGQTPHHVGLCILALFVTLGGATVVAYEGKFAELLITCAGKCKRTKGEGSPHSTDVQVKSTVAYSRQPSELEIPTHRNSTLKGLTLDNSSRSMRVSHLLLNAPGVAGEHVDDISLPQNVITGSDTKVDVSTQVVANPLAAKSAAKEKDTTVDAISEAVATSLAPTATPALAQHVKPPKSQYLFGCALSAAFGALTATSLMPEHFAAAQDQSEGYLGSLAIGVTAAWGFFMILDFAFHMTKYARGKSESTTIRHAVGCFLLPPQAKTVTSACYFVIGSAWSGACIGFTLILFLASINSIGYVLSGSLLQTSLVVSSLWGIILFKEIRSLLRLTIFFVGMICVIGGNVMLSLFM